MDWEKQRPRKRILVSDKKVHIQTAGTVPAHLFLQKQLKLSTLETDWDFRLCSLQVTVLTQEEITFFIISTIHHLNHFLMETKPNFAMETEWCTDNCSGFFLQVKVFLQLSFVQVNITIARTYYSKENTEEWKKTMKKSKMNMTNELI